MKFYDASRLVYVNTDASDSGVHGLEKFNAYHFTREVSIITDQKPLICSA